MNLISLTFGDNKSHWYALRTSTSHYEYYADIIGCSSKSMHILSTRSKVSSKRF